MVFFGLKDMLEFFFFFAFPQAPPTGEEWISIFIQPVFRPAVYNTQFISLKCEIHNLIKLCGLSKTCIIWVFMVIYSLVRYHKRWCCFVRAGAAICNFQYFASNYFTCSGTVRYAARYFKLVSVHIILAHYHNALVCSENSSAAAPALCYSSSFPFL